MSWFSRSNKHGVQNSGEKIGAIPGAQKRGTWGTRFQWFCSLPRALGPPAKNEPKTAVFQLEKTGLTAMSDAATQCTMLWNRGEWSRLLKSESEAAK